MPTTPLDLNDLKEGMPGITPVIGAAFAEAAGVCFQDQQHRPGVEMDVGGLEQTVQVFWPEPSAQALRAWGDEEEATEYGACGVAVLLVEKFTRYTVIERSVKGTGFDYWLGYQTDDSALTFEKKALLEVSGIRKGTEQEVSKRVRQKTLQTSASDDLGLPAYVAVVEFATPRAEVMQK
jgi:hypothetical protein